MTTYTLKPMEGGDCARCGKPYQARELVFLTAEGMVHPFDCHAPREPRAVIVPIDTGQRHQRTTHKARKQPHARTSSSVCRKCWTMHTGACP